ncbi:alpha-glucan phosphorylase [Paenibacillus darwinianus]|uniref:Alpha-glucan phosphorylase n=1 Tax=Paenibacillus darwinianus TaxID=1380763 RepID=A0A9W5S1Q4_9BACL|nr:alpha-glucan family phosphorylase [Paenibacillus darwinianus]EXX88469.1 alpha-glucan phosphorylase [Paenibacillus darwinianus]EXX89283.1 alpha-glucan phosphorylase [Paenibacillus darwinianus]EXX89999.1 alpha-glucan phosphorylase [Paenibacillus darwinianus]
MTASIAYFSAEFGIDASIPIYSGGLGVLAGDHLKAASDLELPLSGVGILYRKGYFRQVVGEDGVQRHLYPEIDRTGQMEQVTDNEGRPLLVKVPIANRLVYLKAWRLQVGRIPLYLLDADVEANEETDRRLTDNLYAGDRHIRICQEIILGIGGVRLLHKLGVKPAVWHMNEGHSAFLTLERIREHSASGLSFHTALEAVKASTVFTTHTPVPAGHDQFDMQMMDHYLGDFYWQLGADRDTILALGRVGDSFNMTRLAMKTASVVNGVSALHEDVTKALFHHWLPYIPKQDIAVASVTNGVHIDTWLSPELKKLFSRYLSADWSGRTFEPAAWSGIRDIPSGELWERHQQAKERLLEGLLPDHEPSAKETLLIGFARRFATYKRALLIFMDLDRLDKIVNDPKRPVSFIFAGKAHPADDPGQQMIRRIVEISQMERFKGRIRFVENYDMGSAKLLVQGVDVWLNTPVKPMEASGTSGQKAALNGVLNCSVLDGWWSEGYNGRNGWAIQGAAEGSLERQAEEDSEALYRLLEEEIAPLYYRRDAHSVPLEWVNKMKESICTLAPRFNTHRMVREYSNRIYSPTEERGNRFTANGYEIAGKVAAYKRFIREQWQHVRVHSMHTHSSQGTRIGLTETFFQVHVYLGPIWEQDVRVEAVGSDGDGGIWKVKLKAVAELGKGLFRYEGTFRDQNDAMLHATANVRVFPVSSDFNNDFEMELTTWG